jgi:hypothetical protein
VQTKLHAVGNLLDRHCDEIDDLSPDHGEQIQEKTDITGLWNVSGLSERPENDLGSVSGGRLGPVEGPRGTYRGSSTLLQCAHFGRSDDRHFSIKAAVITYLVCRSTVDQRHHLAVLTSMMFRSGSMTYNCRNPAMPERLTSKRIGLFSSASSL